MSAPKKGAAKVHIDSEDCWSGNKVSTVHEEFETNVVATIKMPPIFKKIGAGSLNIMILM